MSNISQFCGEKAIPKKIVLKGNSPKKLLPNKLFKKASSERPTHQKKLLHELISCVSIMYSSLMLCNHIDHKET